MKTPPIGVPARAPNDMNINSVPIRAPILSMGDIIVMQACTEKRDGTIDGWHSLTWERQRGRRTGMMEKYDPEKKPYSAAKATVTPSPVTLYHIARFKSALMSVNTLITLNLDEKMLSR